MLSDWFVLQSAVPDVPESRLQVDFRDGRRFVPPTAAAVDQAPDRGWLWSSVACDSATNDVVVALSASDELYIL